MVPGVAIHPGYKSTYMPRKKKEETPVQALETIESAIDTNEEANVKKKKIKFKSASKNNKFDLFAAESVEKRRKELMAKVGLGDGFEAASNSGRDFLPVPWLALQYLIGRPGIPANTITEFIGAESVGKSSLMFALMGCFVANNIPCFYINSEPKALEPDWQLRLLGSDEAKAKVIQSYIDIQPLNSLEEMDTHIRAWVDIKRDEENIPLDVPLVVVVDSITKLMNPEEFAATGFAKVKPGEKKKPEGAVNVSQKPGVTAKWLHQWVRLITPLLQKKNVTIITVSGQNQNMEVTGSPLYKPSEKKNKTRTGGNALNQSAALQFTVTPKTAIKRSSGVDCGKEILLYCVKNSYGPSAREIRYILYDDRKENYPGDIPGTYKQQAIDMDYSLANILVENKVLGITVKDKKFSSTKLDIYNLSAKDLAEYITNDPELLLKVTEALSIKGYELEDEA